jgi:hypothetical protein
MDGENTTLYRDGLHARSTVYSPHPGRSWVRSLHAAIKHHIPENWRICGENVYARHSIRYEDLESFFLVFSIWEGDVCLSWDDTLEWSAILGLCTVPMLFEGSWDLEFVENFSSTLDEQKQEGYVVRLADSFESSEFSTSVCKWVRADHVQTEEHWMRKTVVPNGLRRQSE